MQSVRDEQRIIEIDAVAGRPVHRAWDLGVRDDTSIWFFQRSPNGQYLILDCISESGVGVEYFAQEMHDRCRRYGWQAGHDYVPHDAKIKEWGNGRTRVETMQQLGLNPMLIPLATIADGVNAVRRVLPLSVFHPRCKKGIEALEQYRREWNDEAKTFRASPVHDWTSHLSDAFRYLAQSIHPAPRKIKTEPKFRSGLFIPPPREFTGKYEGLVF
jgi:phage terminase large subunit